MKSTLKKTAIFVLKHIVNPLKEVFYSKNTKRVLLFCSGNPSPSHVIEYFNVIKNIPDVKFYVYFSNKQDEKRTVLENVKKISLIELCLYYFDVVITGFGYPNSLRCRHTKLVYTNHGFHIIGVDGGKTTHAYEAMSKIKPFVICESNRIIAEKIREEYPQLADTVKTVGWKYSEEELEYISNREQVRSSLGFRKNEKVILIAATWGPLNLFHTYGNKIFDIIKSLCGEYTVIVAPHFHEMEENPPKHFSGIEYSNCREQILRLKECGCIVRDPNEPWIPYMAAADIVFTDYSTLSESAVEMGKRVIFSNFPNTAVWRYSVTYRARPYYDTLEKAENLPNMIESVLSKDVPKESELFRDEIYIPRKEYERKILDITNEILER